MRKLILIVVIAISSFFAAGQDTLYFDPGNLGGDGTKNNPYSSIEAVGQHNNIVYMLKRNTVMETSTIIWGSIENITIDAYGQGDRPRLSTFQFRINGSDGFELKNIDLYTQRIVLDFDGSYVNRNIYIYNCLLHSHDWHTYNYGIYGSIQNMVVEDTEIYDIYRDGVYITGAKNIDFINVNIHHVNQMFHSNPSGAGGDCIQLLGAENITMRGCTFDRHDTGRKFSVILTRDVNNILIEDCMFIGPKKTGYGGASFHAGGMDITIRRNIFKNSLGGLYLHSSDLTANHNLFVNTDVGVQFASDGTNRNILNNTFYGTKTAIEGWMMSADVKNNIIYLTSENDVAYHTTASLENNMQNIEGSGNVPNEGIIVADPQFVDPGNDFHLKSSSPAIDAGVDVGLEKDLDAKDTPNGNYDLGAYEYYENYVPDTTSNDTISNDTIVDDTSNVTLEVLPGATIQIGGQTLTTDQDGKANIQLTNGIYQYTVFADGYTEKQGTITVDGQSVTKKIILTAVSYSVKFEIYTE
jgi:hypothetical protein